MLQITNLSISLNINDRVILKNFTFALNNGDRAVIIGEEGNGKSTLLKLIYDPSLISSYASFTGSVSTGGDRCGYLYQELPDELKKLTVYEYLDRMGCFDDASPRELASTARTLGVGIDFLYSDRPIESFSGGEKVKIQLAGILLKDPDILLLDEPTNDIDIETLEWLEDFINNTSKPILYVSHDETLIENTANVIIHLEQVRRKTLCRHTIAAVPYSEYIDSRMRALAHQEQVARKEQDEYEKKTRRLQQIYNKVDHQLNSITRANPHGGRMLKKKMQAVKSTAKRIEREHENAVQLPDVEDAIFLAFDETSLPAGKRVCDINIPALYAGDALLAEDVRLTVMGGEHIGIIGRNGAGKTTFLRMAAEELLKRDDLKAAYMPQNYLDLLPPDECPIDYLAPSGKKDDVTRARSYMGCMRYTHEEMEGRISGLSGGQKAKLLFLKMILDGAQVLILDEPTRNFSPLSNPVIRSVLDDFGGTIISVTHDRKYLSEVCRTVYRLTEKGLVREF